MSVERDAAAVLIPLVLAALLVGCAFLWGCSKDGSLPRRVVTWPPIYGCVDPHGETCATPAPRAP